MYMSYYKAQVIAKICFSSLQGMREEASFRRFFEKVRVLKQKLEMMTQNHHKACVRYFLLNFYFFTK